MAKLPKKDINLYPLVVAPKKNTMKKGVLFGILGTVAVLLLGGSYAGARIYVHTQENLVSEMETKANDTALMEKINNANAVANDIAHCGLPVMFILRCGLPLTGHRRSATTFPKIWCRSWLAVRKRSAPAEEKFRWQRSPDFPMTAAPFPLRQVRRTASMFLHL